MKRPHAATNSWVGTKRRRQWRFPSTYDDASIREGCLPAGGCIARFFSSAGRPGGPDEMTGGPSAHCYHRHISVRKYLDVTNINENLKFFGGAVSKKILKSCTKFILSNIVDKIFKTRLKI